MLLAPFSHYTTLSPSVCVYFKSNDADIILQTFTDFPRSCHLRSRFGSGKKGRIGRVMLGCRRRRPSHSGCCTCDCAHAGNLTRAHHRKLTIVSVCVSARAQSVWQGADAVMETTVIQTVTPADGQRFYETRAGRCLPLTHTHARTRTPYMYFEW